MVALRSIVTSKDWSKRKMVTRTESARRRAPRMSGEEADAVREHSFHRDLIFFSSLRQETRSLWLIVRQLSFGAFNKYVIGFWGKCLEKIMIYPEMK